MRLLNWKILVHIEILVCMYVWVEGGREGGRKQYNSMREKAVKREHLIFFCSRANVRTLAEVFFNFFLSSNNSPFSIQFKFFFFKNPMSVFSLVDTNIYRYLNLLSLSPSTICFYMHYVQHSFSSVTHTTELHSNAERCD